MQNFKDTQYNSSKCINNSVEKLKQNLQIQFRKYIAASITEYVTLSKL